METTILGLYRESWNNGNCYVRVILGIVRGCIIGLGAEVQAGHVARGGLRG